MAATNVAQILAETATRHPDRAAMVLGETSMTYRQVWDGTRRYAAVLRDQGVGPGDRVALLAPNVPQFAMSYYAILALGASVVPVHALLVAEEIAYVLQDSGARLLVAAAPLLAEGHKGAEVAGVPVLSLMDADDSLGVPRLDALAAASKPVSHLVLRDSQDEAVVLYTSGTTGQPKGAMLTHDNILWNATLSAYEVVGMGPDDVILAALPLFHSFGQTVVMNAGFRVGATLALVPRFDPTMLMDLLVGQGVTIFIGVPTMYVALLEIAKSDPRRPHLRTAISGGASLPVAVIDRVKETFGVDIFEGYGLSETSPVASFNQAWCGRKPGSVGRGIWGVDVAVADPEVAETIELLGVDQVGEIVIRGHAVFSGYLGRPEATAAVMVDGWFRTGDLGYADADGFIFIVDRLKDLIIRGGFNVYPREVEEVLSRHPAVSQVAVVGVPDDTYGEEITAVVVPVSGASVTGEELVAYAQEHVGRHMYPRRVEVVQSLPMGPSGKILKREITRSLVAEETDSSDSE